MHARRGGYGLALARLGIVYGPSPVEHEAPESQTVIDKFRRLAAAGTELTLEGGGRATIGAVHVADAARLLLDCEAPAPGGVASYDVAAETLTVADVAALAEGRAPAGAAGLDRRAAVRVRAQRGGIPARGGCMRFLVTGVTGFLGWRTATLLGERGHDVLGLARPGGAGRAHARGVAAERVDAGDPSPVRLIAGCDVVLHFAGVPDPAARARGPCARRCARTPVRRRTCSRAASSTAPRSSTPRRCAPR